MQQQDLNMIFEVQNTGALTEAFLYSGTNAHLSKFNNHLLVNIDNLYGRKVFQYSYDSVIVDSSGIIGQNLILSIQNNMANIRKANIR